MTRWTLDRTLRRFGAGCLAGVVLGWQSKAVSADAVTQCIAANEDSLALRKEGKLLDARRVLSVCAAATCPDAIQRACRGRMADLNSAIPTVVFDVKDTAGHDVMDVKVSVDGQPTVPVRVTAVPLDPGQHVFRFESGQVSVELNVILREGQKDQPVTVMLAGSPPSGPTAPGPGVGPSTATGAQGAAATSVRGFSRRTGVDQRTAGWVIGGVGIGALAAGEILAFVAKSSYDGAGCRGTVCPTLAALDTQNSARNLGNVATGLVAGGGALMAAGLIVWITAPHGQSAAKTSSWQVGLAPRGVAASVDF